MIDVRKITVSKTTELCGHLSDVKVHVQLNIYYNYMKNANHILIWDITINFRMDYCDSAIHHTKVMLPK